MPLRESHTELLRRDPVQILDVGARGGMQRHWDALREYAVFVGFEPDRAECERLQAHAPPNEKYIARALHSSDTRATLHYCAQLAASSLYEPDLALLREIAGSSDNYRVVRTEQLDCTSLDALVRAGTCAPPSFIKLDTQGSELDILTGARESALDSVVGIESEVEFVPLYKNQPLFADVDAFLRGAGFELVDFLDVYTKATMRFGAGGTRGYTDAFAFVKAWRDRFVPPTGSFSGVSSLVYANVLYLRRIDAYLEYASRRSSDARTAVVKAVALATEVEAYDYALELTERAARASLIDGEDQASLARHVHARSRSWKPLAKYARRLGSKLAHRLRHPGRDA